MTEHLKYLRLCAWSGPAFLAIFIVFWGILGHNIPPLPADLPAKAIGDHYRLNANEVRLGMGMSMSFAVLYMIWGLAIAKVMQYGVEKGNDVLSTLELWGAGLTVVPLLVSSSFWLAGAYRPQGLDDSVLQLFYDLPWLLIDVAYMVTSVQMFALGVAFLKDERAVPLVPKWLCWYGIWVGFMFVAEVLMPFFTSGPFARHGVLNFWIEFFIWFFWIVALSSYMLIAIGRLEAEARGIVVEPRAPRLAPAGSVASV